MATDRNDEQTVIGLVEATNPKGVKVEGRWWNWSQYGPRLPRPQRGQTVWLVAKRAFVRELEIVEGDASGQGPGGPPKDVLIVRQTCLKAAAEFCASRAELKSADLLALAERMEAWVCR
jgi:hypothetical protein